MSLIITGLLFAAGFLFAAVSGLLAGWGVQAAVHGDVAAPVRTLAYAVAAAISLYLLIVGLLLFTAN